MITRLKLCYQHKTQQLTPQSHRVKDQFVNLRTMVNSHSFIWYFIQDILELQNMKKIITVIDATFPLYLTIYMVTFQFPQHLVN